MQIAIPVAVEVGAIIVGGLAILLAIATQNETSKVITRAKALAKEGKQPQKCDYCKNPKYNQGMFWDQLPQKKGKYRATKKRCFYKDMKWDGKRLQSFKRTGFQCPHVGQVCAKCGAQFNNPKPHKHPEDCPFK